MILGICGSGRHKGETFKMVNAILEKSEQAYEMVMLSKQDIRGCIGCLKCADGSGRCSYKDDFNVLIDKIKAADVVVLGFPNYGGTVNAMTHSLLERLYSQRHGVYHLSGKPFVLVTPAGKGSAGMNYVSDAIHNNRMTLLHTVSGKGSTAPCYDCGYGHECYAGHAIGKGELPITKEALQAKRPSCFDNDEEIRNNCSAAGWIIKRALLA